MSAMWTHDEAVALCVAVEKICPAFGCHVALTGGLLYKDGKRKDADLLFYRIRQVPSINVVGLFVALTALGIRVVDPSDVAADKWCVRCLDQGGRRLDCLFPDHEGEYPQAAEVANAR